MTLGIISLFIANFVGGAITPMFVKLGVGEIPPLTFTTLRFLIACLVTLPFYLRQPKINKQNFKWLVINSLFFTVNMGLFSVGIQYTNVVISQIFYAFVPIIVAFLGYFLLKEKMNKYKAIGSAVAFLGLLFLVSQSLQGQQSVFGDPLGNLIIMVAVLSWACYIVLSKKIASLYSQISITFANFLICTLILSLFIPFELNSRPFSALQVSSLGIISLLIVSIFSSVIFINLMQFGIKRIGAFLASLFIYIGPLSAAITAVPFLGEKITFNLIIGAVLILFGVFYATTYAKLSKNNE